MMRGAILAGIYQTRLFLLLCDGHVYSAWSRRSLAAPTSRKQTSPRTIHLPHFFLVAAFLSLMLRVRFAPLFLISPLFPIRH